MVLKKKLNKLDYELVSEMLSKFDKLSGIKKGQSILITGGTGLIGYILTVSLVQLSLQKDLNLKIYLLTRNSQKAKSLFGSMASRLNFIEADINNDLTTIKFKGTIDVVIHTAANTSSYDMKYKPVDVINSIVEGTRHVLEFIKHKRTQKFIYLSSMEVYGVTKLKDGIIDENFTGNVDINSIRSSYPEGKRLAEVMVRAYAYQDGFTAIILRPTQTFGIGVDFNDKRVFAEFTREAILYNKITMLTQGRTIRSYVSTLDCVSAIIHAINMINTTDVYNVANIEATISIHELAELIQRGLNNKTTINIENVDAEKMGYAPVLEMKLSNSKLMETGWQPKYSIKDMVNQLIYDFEYQLNDK